MQGQINSLEVMLGALLRAQYGVLDSVRRMQGDALSAFGLGPNECPYWVIASGQHWRLRDYSDSPASHGLLIVAAPIKRPYIWDLTPSISPLRHCLTQRLGVYLLGAAGFARHG